MQRFLCATALLLLALLAVATGQAQQGNTTAPPPPPGAGGFDPSALAGLLPGLPPGSCEPYNPNAIVLSQCNRVIAWPAVYVFQGLNQSTADFIAYNATFQALYKVLPENCTAAVMRLTCIQLFLPCAVFPIPIGPPPTPPFNLSIPFAPCPGLCADMYQYCGPSLAQSAGCANTTAPTPMAPPPSAPAQSASDNTTAPAPAPSAGLPPGIPAELLPLLAAIQALPCATSPFNASIFTRECPPLLVDNVDDDDEGPCAVECPNPLFKYSERLGLSITVTVMGVFSIFYTMFSFFAIMTHPIYRHFPKSAVGYMFFALHFIVWSDFIRLFYLGGEIDGIICVNRQNADFTHAVCGFQAVCLIVGLSGVLWWNVLVVNLFLAAYQLPKPEGVWNRVYHACCHLFIWPFNLTMICLIAGFGIVSDGIISCVPDTSVWRGWMADAFFFIPFSLFELFGFFILTLVVLRILWVLRTKTLAKGASIRMIVFLGYGYLQTLYFLTFHFQYRIRDDAINETYTRYGTCLATTLPWLRDSQCHIDGDHFHYSELIVALLLGALAPWVAFYTLMTKASMWAHWVWAFRVYILRQKDVKMPFEEVRRRQTVSRVSQRMSRSTGTQSASGTQSSTGFTMDMPE